MNVKRKLVYNEGESKIWDIYFDNEIIAELHKHKVWKTKPGKRIASIQRNEYYISWKGKNLGKKGEYGYRSMPRLTDILIFWRNLK